MFVCLFRTWAEHSQDHPIRMRRLRTAALMRHVGPTVPTSAGFCLQKSHACWVSACFRTPRLSLGHPGSFKSAHVLKCMRTQTAPLFNVPRGRRGNTSFSITQIHSCTMSWPGIEPGPLPWEASALTTELHPPFFFRLYINPFGYFRRGTSAAHSAAQVKRPYLQVYAICMRRQSQFSSSVMSGSL